MHDDGIHEPIELDRYRQARQPRPAARPQPVTEPRPQTGMSRYIAELVELAIEAHERRHHGRAS